MNSWETVNKKKQLECCQGSRASLVATFCCFVVSVDSTAWPWDDVPLKRLRSARSAYWVGDDGTRYSPPFSSRSRVELAIAVTVAEMIRRLLRPEAVCRSRECSSA